MSPQDASLLASIIGLIKEVGGLPLIGLASLIVIGPWCLSFILARGAERRFEALTRGAERRFETTVKMYESNVKLVENYEKFCNTQERREQDLRSIIMVNTQAMTRLGDAIEALKGR